MGKVPGILSSIIAVGILAFVIYFCCLRRKKQRNGTTVHVFTNSRVPPAVPNTMPYNPTNPGIVPPVGGGQYGYPYATPGMPMPQPGVGVGNQYGPSAGPQQIPYPTYQPASVYPGQTNMPMPFDNSSQMHGTTPYLPTAPPNQYNDLPPPYSDITKREL